MFQASGFIPGGMDKIIYRLNYKWMGGTIELELIQEIEATAIRRFTANIASFGRINQRLKLCGIGLIPQSSYEATVFEDIAEVTFKNMSGGG